MEVVDNCYEFKFAEVVNKAGGIGNLMNKLDRQTLYEVELFIRNRRPWSDGDMAKILDGLAYDEYSKFESKSLFRKDDSKRKEVEKRSSDNIYFKIHNALHYNKDIDTEDFVTSLIESKFYRQCFIYIRLDGNKLADKVDERLKKDPEALKNIDVIRYLINKYNDVVYMERAYQITKNDQDLWKVAERYYKNGDVKKALAMRPCKCWVGIGNLGDDEKKKVMEKYPDIDLTVYDPNGGIIIGEIVDPRSANRIHSFVCPGDVLVQLGWYEVYFV